MVSNKQKHPKRKLFLSYTIDPLTVCFCLITTNVYNYQCFLTSCQKKIPQTHFTVLRNIQTKATGFFDAMVMAGPFEGLEPLCLPLSHSKGRMKYLKYNKLIKNTTFSKVNRANRGPAMKVQNYADHHITG